MLDDKPDLIPSPCREELELFQRGPVMIIKWKNDESWSVTSVSGNVAQILGYAPEQLVQKQISFKELVHPEDIGRLVVEHDEFIASHGQRFEEKNYRLKSRDGDDVWINAHTIILTESDSMVSSLIDITKRIKAQSALRQSEEMYRTLLNNQLNAVFLHKFAIDGFHRFSEVNQHALDQYGYSREEFLQLSPVEITCSTGTEFAKKEDSRRILLTQGRRDFETIHIKKSGERFPVRISSTVVELQDEKYILSTVQDMTEQKKSEQEKQLSNLRLLTVLNSIDASVYVADMQTHEILFMNESMVRAYGQDLTGDTCWRVFHGEEKPCAICSNDALLDPAGQPKGLNVWQGYNHKTQKYCVNHDRAIEWIDGRMVKLQIATDISELKAMESQLRQKFKMEAVGVMAGGIAHDFNNKLAIILGNIELGQMRLPAENQASANLNNAKTALFRARDLVQQIMTYSRQQEQQLKPLRLSLVIDETLRLLRSTTPSSIQIGLSSADAGLIVAADSTQVQEILINLSNNAVHAMQNEGALQIKVDRVVVDSKSSIPAQFSASPGVFARICIADNGCGIKPALLEKIFDPFFTTKGVGEGTGMGLAVVHGILESHQGFITVSSTENQGSCFAVYLPLTDDLLEDETVIPVAVVNGQERILLVDDEIMLLDVGAQMLTEHGYQVTPENNALKALELFKAQPDRFDLVITDQTMPDLSGTKLIKKMLAIRPDLATIICTGFSDQVDDQSAEKLGARALCRKPFDLTRFMQTVRQALDGA